MYDCKSSGGHFFIHNPNIRSFTCHRCCQPFTNYNPPIPRTKTAKQWYGELADKDRKKAPWRCIVEACAFTACGPCSEFIQRALRRLKDSAEEQGTPFDFQAELAKVEEDGRLGHDAIKTGIKRGNESDTDEKHEREKDKNAAVFVQGDSDKIEVDSRMEVDDDDGEEYSLELFKRPYTRSAAAAAASARGRARRPTTVTRERV